MGWPDLYRRQAGKINAPTASVNYTQNKTNAKASPCPLKPGTGAALGSDTRESPARIWTTHLAWGFLLHSACQDLHRGRGGAGNASWGPFCMAPTFGMQSEWSAIQRVSCCPEIPVASAALWQGSLGSPPQRNADGRKGGATPLARIPGAQIQKGPSSLATPCSAKGAGTALYSLPLALHSGHFKQQLQTYLGTMKLPPPLSPPPQGVHPYLGNSIFSSTCNSTLHATSRHK